MAIDLTLLFIYNYYGENSGDIAPKTAAKNLCKSKNLHMRGAKSK